MGLPFINIVSLESKLLALQMPNYPQKVGLLLAKLKKP